MIPSVPEILSSVPAFLLSVAHEAKELGVDISPFEVDHFCFRVQSPEQYEHYTKEFAQKAELLSAAIINGRPISTFKLHMPVKALGKSIACVEIPFPKAGSPYTLGLEHFECVVEEPLTRFVQRYPEIRFDQTNIKHPLNADVALKLPSGSTIKFHNQSLETVIAIEKKLGL